MPTPETTATPAATPAPVRWQEPPHGGSWLRRPDGSLELLHQTLPATGRVQRDRASTFAEKE